MPDRKDESVEEESGFLAAWGWNWGFIADGHEGAVVADGNVLKPSCGDGGTGL